MKHRHLFFLSTLITLTPCIYSQETNSRPTSVSSSFAQREAAISQEKKRQIDCALSAFDTIQSKEVIYISCPITSGTRLYDYMDKNGFTTYEEAKADKEAFFQNVILPNIQESEAASLGLAQESLGTVISPTAFEKRFQGKEDRWEQNEFMSLWLSMINEKVTRMVLLDGWQYSSGASEEFLAAVLMQMGFSSRNNIATLDARGNEINLNQGIDLIYGALLDLKARGLQSKKLAEILSSLLEAEKIYTENAISTLEYNKDHLQRIRVRAKALFQSEYPDLLPILGLAIHQEWFQTWNQSEYQEWAIEIPEGYLLHIVREEKDRFLVVQAKFLMGSEGVPGFEVLETKTVSDRQAAHKCLEKWRSESSSFWQGV